MGISRDEAPATRTVGADMGQEWWYIGRKFESDQYSGRLGRLELKWGRSRKAVFLRRTKGWICSLPVSVHYIRF